MMTTRGSSRERDKRVLAALWANAQDKSLTPEERREFAAKADEVRQRLRAQEGVKAATDEPALRPEPVPEETLFEVVMWLIGRGIRRFKT